MNSWERFNENMLPLKKEFYKKLDQKDISDEDYAHAQKVWNAFTTKNLGNYHDLYVQTDTLQLADIFEIFRKMCLDIYWLNPAYFVSAPGLAWEACLKKTKVKLELLTDVGMILMFEAGIRGGISKATHKYATANKKYMKNYNKNIPSSYLQYLDENNLYEWAMCKSYPLVILDE